MTTSIEAEAAQAGPATATGGNETLLLTEDDEVVRDLLKAVLRQHGYATLSAASGREALAVAEAHAGPIDLLVPDLVMPGMSGAELARSLRPRPKALYVSGYPGDTLRARVDITGQTSRKQVD